MWDSAKDRAVKNAQTAFVTALEVGVEDYALIEAVFEVTMFRSMTAKEYLESLPEEQRQKVLSCGRNRNLI
jgi:hypothetical protein